MLSDAEGHKGVAVSQVTEKGNGILRREVTLIGYLQRILCFQASDVSHPFRVLPRLYGIDQLLQRLAQIGANRQRGRFVLIQLSAVYIYMYDRDMLYDLVVLADTDII